MIQLQVSNFQKVSIVYISSRQLEMKFYMSLFTPPVAEIPVAEILLEHTYKPHYDYQNFSPLANGTDLNRQKYIILQTHWQ